MTLNLRGDIITPLEKKQEMEEKQLELARLKLETEREKWARLTQEQATFVMSLKYILIIIVCILASLCTCQISKDIKNTLSYSGEAYKQIQKTNDKVIELTSVIDNLTKDTSKVIKEKKISPKTNNQEKLLVPGSE